MEVNDKLVSLITWGVGFLITSISLILTVRHFKITRAVAYIERVNSPHLAEVRAAVDGWLNTGGSEEDKMKKINEDHELRSKLVVLLNIFTELGIAYKFRVVNRKITREIWYPMIPDYWDKTAFYIHAKRQSGSSIGHNFEYIQQKIRNAGEKKTRRRNRRLDRQEHRRRKKQAVFEKVRTTHQLIVSQAGRIKKRVGK